MQFHLESQKVVVSILLVIDDEIGVCILGLETKRHKLFVLIQKETCGGFEGQEVPAPGHPGLIRVNSERIDLIFR